MFQSQENVLKELYHVNKSDVQVTRIVLQEKNAVPLAARVYNYLNNDGTT
jgi:hypothetical protein